MIKVNSLSFKIEGNEILKSINLQISPGEIHVIAGQNGCGKSTLLKHLSRFLPPQKGEISLNDKLIQNFSLTDWTKNTTVISQQIPLAFPFSVRQIVAMGRYPHYSWQPSNLDLEIIDLALSRFNLIELENRNFQTLSGGEKQRVLFAKMLAQIDDQEAPLLLLDEPLNALDVHFQIQLMSFLKQFVSKKPTTYCIVILHDIHTICKYADAITFLRNGEVLVTGKKEEVLNSNFLEVTYDTKFQEVQTPHGRVFIY